MSRVSEAIAALQTAMDEEGINPVYGMPLDLFEFSTIFLPFINVDLIITNDKNQILLSWRDDAHYGTGWQIPGGIIRMMETIDERIQKTAVREVGCEVDYVREPIVVHENIIRKERAGLKNQLIRAHNVALIYRCRVSSDFVIDNHDLRETDEGYLRWFDRFPENLLDCHKPLQNYEAFEDWF